MNYMEQVANMLGVKLGEKFLIKYINNDVCESDYYFDKNGLCCMNSNFYWSETLNDILNGKAAIVKKPWKPERGEGYFYVDSDGCVAFTENHGSEYDLLLFKIGNCYSNREEAEADAPKWKAFFESEERIDVFGGQA